MRWDFVIAITAIFGLGITVITIILSRSKQEGIRDANDLAMEKRVAELESKVRHAVINIAVLDERTTGGRTRGE